MAESLADNSEELSSADPGEQLALAQQIDRIVAQIPLTYRKAFIMHKRDGLSCQEIADALQLTKRSVEIYLARAIAYARNARWK
jgi:RNA polymerase sigma-70 factor (ECF subfamily)